jgi:putative ABC transport system permease protein
LIEAAAFGVLTGAIFALWPLARTERVRAASLFRTRSAPLTGSPRPVWVALTVGLAALLVTLAAWRAEMWALTFWSAAGVLAAFLVLLAVASALRRVSRWLAARVRRGGVVRLAVGGLGAPGGEVGSVVLSLGLGLSVLAAIGQIDWNLRTAIARDLPEVAPSFFMVDIQPDQIDPFLDTLTARESVSRIDHAPMLRGIITEINGRPAREVAGSHWTLEGDRGVTYSEGMPEGAKIDAGEWWPDDYQGPPLVSFATEEGAELGLSLGDRITVNILGRDIEAVIANFREVDFSEAGIAFIMSMNPGALRGAPHSFIATVYAEAEDEAEILDAVAEAFPNVTAVSVRDAIGRVSELLAGIAAAITWGALATLVTGVVVILGAAAGAVRARTYEAAVLKTLGASRRRILVVFAIRSALMGAAAGLVAIVAGGAAAWAVMTFVMETDFVFEPVSALLIVVGGAMATLLGGLAFVWGPMRARPAGVLRAAD